MAIGCWRAWLALPQRALRGRRGRGTQANLTPARIAGEVAYLNATGRESLSAPTVWPGCCSWAPSCASAHAGRGCVVVGAKPLEEAVVARLKAWLPKLAYPIREGEHRRPRLRSD